MSKSPQRPQQRRLCCPFWETILRILLPLLHQKEILHEDKFKIKNKSHKSVGRHFETEMKSDRFYSGKRVNFFTTNGTLK